MSALVGRRMELEHGIAAVQQSRGVVFHGEAGVGKTALLNHLVQRFRRGGRRVIELQTAEATRSIPLWPFFQIFGQHPPADWEQLLATAHEFLEHNDSNRPTVVAIDDANQLDDASISLLRGLFHDSTWVVLATVRDDDDIPEQLEELWELGIESHSIQPIAVNDNTALVSSLLGGPVTDSLAHAVLEVARGNALMTREVLLDAIERNEMVDTGTIWQLRNAATALDAVAGGRTTRFMQRRLSRLDDDSHHLLNLVAIAGFLPISQVPEHLRRCIETLTDRRLLTIDQLEDRPALTVDHPLIGETTRSTMAEITRWSLLQELIVCIENDGKQFHGDHVRMASWAQEAGHELTAQHWVAAAGEALSTFDVDQALQYATLALESDDSLHHAYRVLGQALRLNGDLHDAATALSTANGLATSEDDIASTAIELSALLGLQLGEPTEAMDILMSATRRLRDPALIGALRSESGIMATLLGRFEDVLLTRPSREELDVATPTMRWQLHTNEAYARIMLGKLEGIDQVIDDAHSNYFSIAEERPHGVDSLMGLLGAARIQQGEFNKGVHELNSFVEARRDRGEYRGVSAAVLSLLMDITNHPRADEVAQEALAQHMWLDPFGSLPIAYSARILAACSTDTHNQIDELSSFSFDEPTHATPWNTIWLGRSQARLAWENGHDEAAAKQCISAGELGVDTSHFAYAAVTVHDAVIYGAAETALPVLRDSVERTSHGEFLHSLLRHGEAVVAGEPDRLEESLHEFLELSATRLAAHTAAQLADCLVQHGDDVRACRAYVTSKLLESDLPGGRIAHVDSVDHALSDRQIEIAGAAVSGMTSRQIADTHFVSVRTVDNHLHSVYRSLGVDGRRGLQELFEPLVTAIG